MNLRTPIRAVAFDLGGVLVDVDRARVARALALDPSLLEDAFFHEGIHDDVTVGALGGDAFIARAAARLAREAMHVHGAWSDLVEVDPRAPALLEELPVPWFYWTNTDPVHWARMAPSLPRALADVERHGVSFLLQAMKPDVQFYERALARCACAAQDVLFLDDRADNVAAARALGVRAEVTNGVDEARAHLVAHGVLAA